MCLFDLQNAIMIIAKLVIRKPINPQKPTKSPFYGICMVAAIKKRNLIWFGATDTCAHSLTHNAMNLNAMHLFVTSW